MSQGLYGAGASPVFVGAGDLDGDMDLDLAVTSEGVASVVVLSNQRNGP
jgi:hypothetical protein